MKEKSVTSNYIFNIRNNEGENVVDVTGPFAVVDFAAKYFAKELAGYQADYSASFMEVGASDEVNALAEDRKILSLTADGDTISTVLKRKLSAERKAVADRAPSAPEDMSTTTVYEN